MLHTPIPTTLTDLLIWVYHRQKADLISGIPFMGDPGYNQWQRPHRASYSQDGCVTIARAAKLGIIAPSSARQQSLNLHPDAEKIHLTLANYSQKRPYAARLLREHARQCTLPEICLEQPIPRPLKRLTRNNRLKTVDDRLSDDFHVELQHVTGSDGQSQPSWVKICYPFCPLVYEPSLEYIEESRLEYLHWYQGLCDLKAQCPSLKKFIITSLGADAPAR